MIEDHDSHLEIGLNGKLFKMELHSVGKDGSSSGYLIRLQMEDDGSYFGDTEFDPDWLDDLIKVATAMRSTYEQYKERADHK